MKTQENCEEFISSTPRIRNSKKPSRTRVRSWKHQSLLLCPVKLRRIVGMVHLTKIRQNLRVFWKLMNPQECAWEIRYHQLTKTILQEKMRIHDSTIIWFTNLSLRLKAVKLPAAKAESECPDIWIRLPRHKWPKSWSSMEDPVVPCERNSYGHPLAGLLWERQFERILSKHGWENWECLFVHREKG